MTQKDFIPKQEPKNIEPGEVTWQSPSNIALVKYWGKKENQIPANPSISFTLENCRSTTTLKFSKKETSDNVFEFDFYFEGQPKEDFNTEINLSRFSCAWAKRFSAKGWPCIRS